MNRLICVVAILCFSSCSFHRLITGKDAKRNHNKEAVTDSGITAVAPLPVLSPLRDTAATAGTTANNAASKAGAVKELISELTPLWNNRLTYQTFKGKAKVHIDGPDGKLEFTAHFRVRKDSVIWIEADGLGGIYRVRILITPDSIFMINYLQKEVTEVPLSQTAKILPAKVNFSSMQHLLTGEPLMEGTITDAGSTADSWSLQVEDSNYIQRITYSKTDSTMRAGTVHTRSPKGPTAMTEYSNYDTTGNRKISTVRSLNIQNGIDEYSLDINILKTDFDEPLDFPFNIPKNYSVKQ